jgi:hypothetical protein
MQSPGFEEMREILKDILVIQDQQAKMLLKHSEILVEHDERMDRVGRHLEVLASISDEPIRNKADRKKR